MVNWCVRRNIRDLPLNARHSGLGARDRVRMRAYSDAALLLARFLLVELSGTVPFISTGQRTSRSDLHQSKFEPSLRVFCEVLVLRNLAILELWHGDTTLQVPWNRYRGRQLTSRQTKLFQSVQNGARP